MCRLNLCRGAVACVAVAAVGASVASALASHHHHHHHQSPAARPAPTTKMTKMTTMTTHPFGPQTQRRLLHSRREALIPTTTTTTTIITTSLLLSGLFCATPASARCKDIETCREEGERRFEEAERKAGPVVNLAGGVRYREMERGSGALIETGDAADIRFQVLKGNGDFIYSVPNREPGATDLSRLLRVTVGGSPRDVPEGVEDALVGAARGTRRRVELPPAKGFATSDWRPEPDGYAGAQRMKRFRGLLSGNGLQPGYDATILFEFEVVRVKKKTAA